MNFSKDKRGQAGLWVIVIVLAALAGIGVYTMIHPSQPFQATPSGQPGTPAGANPPVVPNTDVSTVFSLSNSIDSSPYAGPALTVKLFKNGEQVNSATSSSNTVTFAAGLLQPNTTYTWVLENPSGANIVYPTSGNFTTGSTSVGNPLIKFTPILNSASASVAVKDFSDNALTGAQSIGAAEGGYFHYIVRFPSVTGDVNQFSFSPKDDSGSYILNDSGNPLCTPIVVVDYNSVGLPYANLAMYEDSTSAGAVQKDTSIPPGHIAPDTNRQDKVAFHLKAAEFRSGAQKNLYLYVKAGDYDPVNTLDANNGIRLTMYDCYKAFYSQAGGTTALQKYGYYYRNPGNTALGSGNGDLGATNPVWYTNVS